MGLCWGDGGCGEGGGEVRWVVVAVALVVSAGLLG